MNWHPFKVSLFFAIPMLAIGAVLLFINPKPLNNLPEGFHTPVLAFEFMADADETAALFDVDHPVEYRNAFTWGNAVDYLFMFFYSVFLAFTVLGAIRETGERVIWLAVALCLLVFFADMLENISMAVIVEAYFNREDLLASHYGNLKFFTWLKWGGLSVVFLMLWGYFFQRNWLGKLIAAVILANFGLSVAAYFHRSIINEWMALSVMLVFLLMVVHHALFRTREDREAALS
jgi:hypothetical protein